MALFAAVLYLFVVYIRPAETVSALRGLPVAVYASVVTVIMGCVAAVIGRRAVLNAPADKYAYGVLAIAMFSSVLHGWTGGAIVVLYEFGPSLITYFLLRVAVDSERRLTSVATVLVLLTTFLAANGLAQAVTGRALGDVQALEYRGPVEEAGLEPEAAQEIRIQGTGIFNDPNDLAMVLVMALPLALAGATSPARAFPVRAFMWLSVATSLVAIVLTRSRGGLLGLGVASFILISARIGKLAAVGLTAIPLVVFLTFAGGRMGNISAQEESAQGRVEAWSVGLQMVKEQPLFGVGYGAFTDYHWLGAHNSFVHIVAELGLAGGFCFVALIYWYFRAFSADSPAGPGQSVTWLASGAGALTCAAFLSRQYVAPLYVLFAVAASVEAQRSPERPRAPSVLPITGLLVGAVVATYAAVRLLGAWS